MQQNERAYRFIDDPAHKENLSGRVTAACLQCRRKKIKCSGEVGTCRQCREKGLDCEGPSSRKRSRRDDECSAHDRTPDSKEQSEPSRNSKDDRHQQSRPPGPLPTEDSGYGSHERESNPLPTQKQSPPGEPQYSSGGPTWSPAGAQTDNAPGNSTFSGVTYAAMSSVPTNYTSPFAFNTSVSHYSSPTNVSPASHIIEDWNNGSQGSTSLRPHHSNPTASSDLSHSTHTTPAAMSAGSIENSRNSPTDWWPGASDDTRSSRDLISTAEVLEGQARSLRRQAARLHSGEDDAMRLETFSQPPYSAGNSNAGIEAEYYDSNVRPPDAFSMSEYFLPDGAMRSGLTPGEDGYPSWWDNNSEMQATQYPTRQYSMPTHMDHASGPFTTTEARQTQSQDALPTTAIAGRGGGAGDQQKTGQKEKR